MRAVGSLIAVSVQLLANSRKTRSPGRAAMCMLLFAAASCGPTLPNTDMRSWTPEFEFRISSDIVPPRALEQVHYTITVRENKTHEPIANGQGRIFATNADGHSIYDGFSYGPEVGVYHATLMFVTAGDWAMNLQFRRDSTKALQKPDNDWRQTVLVASEPGSTKP
jgi:hypothetical protein